MSSTRRSAGCDASSSSCDELLGQGERSGAFNVIDRAQTVTAILFLGIDVARCNGARGSPTAEVVGQLHGELTVCMLAPGSVSAGAAGGLTQSAAAGQQRP